MNSSTPSGNGPLARWPTAAALRSARRGGRLLDARGGGQEEGYGATGAPEPDAGRLPRSARSGDSRGPTHTTRPTAACIASGERLARCRRLVRRHWRPRRSASLRAGLWGHRVPRSRRDERGRKPFVRRRSSSLCLGADPLGAPPLPLGRSQVLEDAPQPFFARRGRLANVPRRQGAAHSCADAPRRARGGRRRLI